MIRLFDDGAAAALAGPPEELRQLVAELRTGSPVAQVRMTPSGAPLRVAVVDGVLELSGDVEVVLSALEDVAAAAQEIGSGEVCRHQRIEAPGSLPLVVTADWP